MRKLLSLFALVAGFALTWGGQPQSVDNQSWWNMESEPTPIADLQSGGTYAIAFQTDEAGTLNFWHYSSGSASTSIWIDETSDLKSAGVITDVSYVWNVNKYQPRDGSYEVYMFKKGSSASRIIMPQRSYSGGKLAVLQRSGTPFGRRRIYTQALRHAKRAAGLAAFCMLCLSPATAFGGLFGAARGRLLREFCKFAVRERLVCRTACGRPPEGTALHTSIVPFTPPPCR